MELFTVLITIVLLIVGLVVLAWIIRRSVKKGIEDVLYHQAKDGTWEAHPDLVKVVSEISRKTKV